MESIFSVSAKVLEGVRRDMRVRWGLGAGASVLLSAGVLGLGGSLTPEFLHASAARRSLIPQERIEAQSLEVVDMSTSTVFQVIGSLRETERFELMLYNSGADEALKRLGTYTVFVPSSADFDYLPKRYIAGLSRAEAKHLALGHIVPRALPMEEALSGRVITLGGTAASFDVDESAKAATVDGAQVLRAYKASNGYVYVIDRVLADTE
jgi:uncharacterized surface protein with fasciclin (FAS1) repeats